MEWWMIYIAASLLLVGAVLLGHQLTRKGKGSHHPRNHRKRK